MSNPVIRRSRRAAARRLRLPGDAWSSALEIRFTSWQFCLQKHKCLSPFIYRDLRKRAQTSNLFKYIDVQELRVPGSRFKG